ncbi:hypothetical protein CRYUN_Cryun01aG0172900 [Craigia yunnanensis]
MASAKRIVAFLLMLAFFGVSIGAVYKVGDSTGWTSLGNIDYSKWASTQTFHVGDSLLFEYNSQFHNVMQVTHKDFHSCNRTSAIASYTSGSDSVTLKRPGHYYFLCGAPGHCQAGQKVDVLVTSSSVGPSASPSPSTFGSSSANPPSEMLAPGPTKSSALSLISSKLSLTLSVATVGGGEGIIQCKIDSSTRLLNANLLFVKVHSLDFPKVNFEIVRRTMLSLSPSSFGGLPMVSSKNAMLMLTISAHFAICFGTVYRVGDTSGWHPMFDYRKWASSKKFCAGDTIRLQEKTAFLLSLGTATSFADSPTIANGQKVDIYVREASNPAPANSHPLPPSPAAENPAPTSVSTNSASSLPISSLHQIATKSLAMVVLAYFV